ncbi:MAG: hypothetical protein ABIQ74_11225 [Chitinophagales bacterium]
MFRNLFRELLLIASAATVFCYVAFYNHFPLTFDDTGAYLLSGFRNEVPDDRPILYGLFVRHISMWESLWLVIFSQGLILSYLLFLLFKHFLSIPIKLFWYVVLVVLLAFFTGASINVSQLIPDLFTSVMLICMALLLSGKLFTGEKIFVSVMLVFSTSTHNTHPLIGLIALLIYTVVVLVCQTGGSIKSYLGSFLLAFMLLMMGGFIIPGVNYLFNGHFGSNKASHVFTMYKLNEMGILDNYLIQSCETKHWQICEFRDSIPVNFIWDRHNSPVYKQGGWNATRGEYDSIISDIFSQPRYIKWFAEKAVSNSMEQLFTFEAGKDLPQNTPETAPYVYIQLFFPGDIKQVELSRQYNRGLNFTRLNNWQFLILIISIICLLLISFLHAAKISPALSRTGLILLLGIFSNAVVCGSLSIVVDRYQSRVIWLLPLFVFILLLEQRTVFASFKKLMSEEKSPS